MKEKRFDVMMGVGAVFYPDPSFFIEEVLRLGLSKRVPDCPKWFSGKIWLLHWKTRKFFGFVEGVECREVTPEEAESEHERGCGKLKAGKPYLRKKEVSRNGGRKEAH